MGHLTRRRFAAGCTALAPVAIGVALVAGRSASRSGDRNLGRPTDETSSVRPPPDLAAPVRESEDRCGSEKSLDGESEANCDPPTPAPPSRTATLVVRFLDPEGRPIDDVHPLDPWVSVRGIPTGGITHCGPRDDPPPRESERRLTDLPAGPHVAEITVGGYLPAAIPFEAVADSESVVVVRLDEGLRFAGVVADESGRPVAGASLSFRHPVAAAQPLAGLARPMFRSDADGRFRVTGLARSEWVAEAEAGDVEHRSSALTTTPFAFDTSIDDAHLVLTGCAWISLRALSDDGAAVTPSALFPSTASDRCRASSVRLDDGRTVLGPFEPGEQSLSLTFDRFAPIRREVALRWGETVELGDVGLDPGVTWAGQVVDAAGAPIEGADVQVDVEGAHGARSDAAGRFRFDHLPRRPVVVSVDARGLLRVERGFDLAREHAPERIATSGGAMIRGRIVGVKPDEVNGVEILGVRASSGDEGDGHPRTETAGLEDDGSFELRVAPGRWRLDFVAADGATTALGEWTVVEGATKGVGSLARPK